MTFSRTNILLPHDRSLEAMRKWSIVACDQYTSERSYWQSTADFVGDAPSALHLIVPEVYLNDDDIDKRIGDISQTMKAYLDSGVFDEIKNSYKVNKIEIDTKSDINQLIKNKGLEIKEHTERKYIISIKNEEQANELLEEIVNKKILIDKFELVKPTLHEIFIEKVGEQ